MRGESPHNIWLSLFNCNILRLQNVIVFFFIPLFIQTKNKTSFKLKLQLLVFLYSIHRRIPCLGHLTSFHAPSTAAVSYKNSQKSQNHHGHRQPNVHHMDLQKIQMQTMRTQMRRITIPQRGLNPTDSSVQRWLEWSGAKSLRHLLSVERISTWVREDFPDLVDNLDRAINLECVKTSGCSGSDRRSSWFR